MYVYMCVYLSIYLNTTHDMNDILSAPPPATSS